MAKRKPAPKGVSRTVFARHRGVSRNTVSKHLASGLLKPAVLPDGTLDEALADALLDANLTRQPPDENSPSDLTLARRRKTRASIRKLRDECIALQSEYAPIELLHEFERPNVEAIITRLRRIPRQAAKGIVGRSPAVACEHVRAVIYEALTQLGDGHGLSGPPDDGEEPDSEVSIVGNSVQLSALLTDMQAVRIELLREIKTGGRVSVDEFFEGWDRRIGNCRQQMIGLPTKLASQLAMATSEKDARDLIARDVEHAVTELKA